jgi:hypothetical protein
VKLAFPAVLKVITAPEVVKALKSKVPLLIKLPPTTSECVVTVPDVALLKVPPAFIVTSAPTVRVHATAAVYTKFPEMFNEEAVAAVTSSVMVIPEGIVTLSAAVGTDPEDHVAGSLQFPETTAVALCAITVLGIKQNIKNIITTPSDNCFLDFNLIK